MNFDSHIVFYDHLAYDEQRPEARRKRWMTTMTTTTRKRRRTRTTRTRRRRPNRPLDFY